MIRTTAFVLFSLVSVAAFEQSDTGLIVLDGKLLEPPVLRRMRRILSLAGRDRASS